MIASEGPIARAAQKVKKIEDSHAYHVFGGFETKVHPLIKKCIH
jgi:hypothetical protein